MAGFRSSASITTVCIVGNRQLGRFGPLKHLLRAIQTSWIAAFIFIVTTEAWFLRQSLWRSDAAAYRGRD
jgi:hypothetical protein